MHIRFGGTFLDGPGLVHMLTYSLTDTGVERGQGGRLVCCRYTRAVIKDDCMYILRIVLPSTIARSPFSTYYHD